MDFLKYITLFFALLVCAAAVALPEATVETKPDVPHATRKNPFYNKLKRPKRQFGYGGGLNSAFSSASANSGNFGGGFGGYPPYGGGFYPGGGGNSFAQANAVSGSFGRK